MKTIRTLVLISALICITTISFGQEITDNFSYYPKIEFNDKIVESNINENNGTTFQKIVIDGFDSRIPFYLIEQTDKKEDRFVILLHGLTSSKDDWINLASNNKYSERYVGLKDTLLTLGYSLIIPDAKYHGERSYEADFASPVTLYSSQDLQKAYNLITTTVKDIRIIMDYIQKSNNASITFDVIGYSMGGMQTIFLNSVDDRLNRVVVCVSPFNHPKGAQMLGMNEEYANKLDIISPHNNYASLQKAPVTLLMGANDVWYTKEEVQDFFEKININDKTLKFYQSGHFLPKEFIFDAIESINKE